MTEYDYTTSQLFPRPYSTYTIHPALAYMACAALKEKYPEAEFSVFEVPIEESGGSRLYCVGAIRGWEFRFTCTPLHIHWPSMDLADVHRYELSTDDAKSFMMYIMSGFKTYREYSYEYSKERKINILINDDFGIHHRGVRENSGVGRLFRHTPVEYWVHHWYLEARHFSRLGPNVWGIKK